MIYASVWLENIVVIVLIILIWSFKLMILRVSNINLLAKEQDLMSKIEKSRLNPGLISLPNNEKVIYQFDDINIYTFNKSSNYTKQERFGYVISMFSYLSSQISYSLRTMLFTNSLRLLGVGSIMITNYNLIFVTQLGHYKIKRENIVYVNGISENYIIVIEKQKKSFVFEIEEKNHDYFYNLIEKKLKVEVLKNKITLAEFISLYKLSNFDEIKFSGLMYNDKIMISRIRTPKQMLEDIVITLINDGYYIEPIENFISFEPLISKKKKVMKSLKHVGNYYMNTSSNIDKYQRLEIVLQIIKQCELNPEEFVIEYYY